jgi:hypothetical protein
MEPHREDQQKALQPSATPKPKRFRIVKLEERIAPTQGGGTQHGHTCRCVSVQCGTTGCTPVCPTASPCFA